MATLFARQVFQPSCPQGGSWAACAFGSRFVGCCLDASAACVDGCSQSDLKPASFLKDRYRDITGSVCTGDSEWYTCASISPTFMGCCASDPCKQNGCPTNDLRAATLSQNDSEAGPYSAVSAPSAAITLPSSPPSSPTSSATNAIASNLTTVAPSTTTSNTSTTAIAGGVVGGCVAISLLAILIFFLVRRRNRRRTSAAALVNTKETSATSDQSSSNIPTPLENSSSFSMPVQELETPPPDPWHSPRGERYELPSPDLASEKQCVEGSGESIGIYRPYRPADKERPARHKLYDEGRNVSYELDGRGIDYHRES